ncbi:conserved hypothetical protein [Luminiphilus syltensis NOR5-1B]|uniref:SnoaL-like domain-containing protein n=1 Tax=Luminiphilus syltensis NOR5-1B TaxID=565045 RepID=B8KQH8_9GAMM|nr:nuclear transport factor 2 family protein [Luminiphilus syltensis]EED35139.1 conserved hypothetical protein [Luminiphilus syltensis NOR5-1B]
MNKEETAILALMREYCDSIDRGDLAGCAALFSDGSWGIEGSMAQGADEVKAQLDNVTLYEGKPLTRHLMSNVQIFAEEGSTTAEARSCITVMQCVPPDFPMQAIFIGTYYDTYALRESEWCFVERRIVPDLVGNMAFHRADMA